MTRHSKQGFTLIELLAVIVLLAIILAIAIPGISGVIRSATKGAFESDAKMVLTALDYKKLENESFNPTSLTLNEIEEELKLSSDNYKNVIVEEENGQVIIKLIGKNKWDGLSACGTIKNMTVYEDEDCGGNADITPPTLTLIGDNPVQMYVGELYSDPGYQATDREVDVTDSVTASHNLNVNIPGTYTITYEVTDVSGNTTRVTRSVVVIDNQKPIISISPNTSETYKKELNVTVTVVDTGGVDSDSLKYSWTTSATEPALEDFTNTYANNEPISSPSGLSGNFYLWVMASDEAGNTLTSSSDVFNIDNELPVLTLTGNSNVTINKGSIYSDAGATAIDNHSGIDGSVTVTGTVNVNVIGTYSINYDVTDKAGNQAVTVTRIVNVIDVSAPVITILGTNPVTLNIGTVYSDEGATALDDVDGDVTSKIITTGMVNLNVVGTYTINYAVSDIAGNNATASRTINVIDTIAPSVPTVLGMTFADGITAYVNNTWTNQSVYIYDRISGSTDANGIAKYQISSDNVTWVDYVYDSTVAMYAIKTDGTYYRYARAVDKAGNVSAVLTKIIKIDKTTPTVPTVMGMTFADGVTAYVNGAWSSQAVYIYGGISGSTDANGIAKYQISSDNVTWVDYAYDYVNPIYGLSTQGIQYRYARAVDTAGNASTVLTKTIRIDSVTPTHTNWWWGTVTSAGASLYIQTNDSTSGINRVQCPTSTEAGGYVNWNWFTAVWDAGANAYRCDVTSSTFGHYGQTYITHLYIWDNAENGGYYNQTSIYVNPNIYYLVDSVNVGDFISYTGNNGCTNCSGQSVTCYGTYANTYSGWRVLSKSGSGASGTVTIVSAGTTMCTGSGTVDVINSYGNRYLNTTYATSARSINCNDALPYSSAACTNYTTYVGDTMIQPGGFYYFATATSPGGSVLWAIVESGRFNTNAGYTFGLRPVITLKAGIQKAAGSGTSSVPYTIQ